MEKIKVVVRTRPFNKRELELRTTQSVTIADNQVILTAQSKSSGKNVKTFTFDRCFDSTQPDSPNFASQQTVYDGLGVDALENIFAGYNACIFAYGQTGSGKSYTITGAAGASESNKGLLPRLCEDLFKRIEEQTSDELTFKVQVSYMEIYNEKLRDLLDPSGVKQNLKVREHQLLGIYVDGLSQLAVASYKDIEAILNEGNKSRTVAATNMNAESSRSHAVFCVKVSQNMLDTKTNISGEKVSRLSIVDLAGSEKVSKTGVEGDRLKEGCNINRSLHTLGQVISTLADNASLKAGAKPKHIPYRDSVLTWLLKDSLGGNSKTVMISTISPAADNYEETLSTLRYSDRAKRIVNNAVVNEDPNAKVIRNLREEVEALKRELERAKEQIKADDLKDRLIESEKLYNDLAQPWTEKLAETEKVQLEWTHTLQGMGISVQSSGIKVEKDKYYLVNMNADPSLNELLVYYLKDLTLVGRADAKNKQDIQLMGPGIAAEHCAFYLKNEHICVTPIKQAKTWVNGNLISGETLLNNGDRIALGINHFFKLNCPASYANPSASASLQGSPTHSPRRLDSADFKSAQEEVLLPSAAPSKQLASDSEDGGVGETSKSPSSLSPTNSIDENGVALEYAIKKLEDEYAANWQAARQRVRSATSSRSSMSRYNSDMNVNESHFRQGLDKLREQLLRANTLAREANSICKEINKPFRFGVTLQIPAHNLTPKHKRDALLSEPAIVVKNKRELGTQRTRSSQDEQFLIDLEKFENYIVLLREAYAELFTPVQPTDSTSPVAGLSATKSSLIESMFDYESYNNLVGVANVFLDGLVCLAELSDSKPADDACLAKPLRYEYGVPIVNQQGEIAGRLLVKLELQIMPGDDHHHHAASESSNEEEEEEGESHTSIYQHPSTTTSSDGDNPTLSSFSLRRPKVLRFKLSIVEASDLPSQLVHNVFCHYQFWNKGRATLMPQSVEKLASKKFLDRSTTTTPQAGGKAKVRFNHEVEFLIDLNEEFDEYCQDCGGSLAIELFSNRYVSPLSGDNQQHQHPVTLTPAAAVTLTPATRAVRPFGDESRLTIDLELLKQQSLIDTWNEVSKSFEMNVKILELNADQQWQPVEVKQTTAAYSSPTGGIYQLRPQRQPRQVLVTVRPASAHSVMCFSGHQFHLEPHRIDQVSIGCVCVTNPHRQLLDSYQEQDLNRLRERCRRLIESRKQYLKSQLALLTPTAADDGGEQQQQLDDSEEARERYESLCEQLSDLSKEQVAIDAPESNSRLPGSTIEWQPAPGMEQHVPVIFLDLKDSGEGDHHHHHQVIETDQHDDDSSGQGSDLSEEEDEPYGRRTRTDQRTPMGGLDATLAHEAGQYVDFEIINWNDSSQIEVKRGDQKYAYHPSAFADQLLVAGSPGVMLKAVAAWDSYVHQDIFLKSPTPLDTHVYLIVKVNLKFKKTLDSTAEKPGRRPRKSARYVNVILRKRICVNISSAAVANSSKAAAGFSTLKSFISPSLNRQVSATFGGSGGGQVAQVATGITYRIISHIPKTFGEIESRKSLALKAASSVVTSTGDIFSADTERVKPQYNISHFEFYAKTIQAVDSILQRDRDQQRLAIKKELGGGKLGSEALELANLRTSRSSLSVYKSSSRLLADTGMSSFKSPMMSGFSDSTPYEDDESESSRLPSYLLSGKNPLNSFIEKTINVLNNTVVNIPQHAFSPMPKPASSSSQDDLKVTPAPYLDEKSQSTPSKVSRASPRIITESEYSKAVPTAGPASSKLNAQKSKQGISELFQMLATDEMAEKPTTGARGYGAPQADTAIVESGVVDLVQDLLASDFKSEPPAASTLATETTTAEVSHHQLSVLDKSTDFVQSSQSLSNQSIVSGSATSQYRSSSGRLNSDEPVPEWVKEGAHVIVSTNSTVLNKRGHVRYVGATKFGHGTWIGVELEEASGKNDGSVKGERYFQCPANKGVFVRADKLTLVRSLD